jgi:XTP/dITP diphosphohydrolase
VIPRLVVASKNLDKVSEIESLLEGTGLVTEVVRGLEWPDVEETGSTLEENARLKARAVIEATGLPVLADDTGLEVDALDGEPGVATARFAGPSASYAENVARMLEAMAGDSRRSARFRTVVVLGFPDGVEMVAEGILEGQIAEEPRGADGFGYDPVFEVDGRTLAEMTPEEKNSLSHRARAIHALVEAVGL